MSVHTKTQLKNIFGLIIKDVISRSLGSMRNVFGNNVMAVKAREIELVIRVCKFNYKVFVNIQLK